MNLENYKLPLKFTHVKWIFIVYISLLSKLFPKITLLKQLFPLRRFAGILVFGIILCHAIFHFLKSGVLGNFEGIIFQVLERDWAITLGTIAFICMTPLFLTSTPKAIQKLGQKNWFALHKANHLIFILASLHIGFLTYSEKGNIDPLPLILLGVYFLGYGYLRYTNYIKGETK